MSPRIHGAAILNYLRGRLGDMKELLRQLTELETPSVVPESQAQAVVWVAGQLEVLGFKTRLVPGRTNGPQLYARPGTRVRHQPSQLLLGHVDTVWPIGTLKSMPFKVSGNVVHGPGVFDMKGGIVQMILALHALADLRIQPRVTPVVFLNCDEEIGSRESRRTIETLARRMNRVYVLEPALGPTGKIKTKRKGVGRFTVAVKGRAAHAGLDPEGGASAILEMSHVIQTLFALNDVDRGVTVNVGTVDGGLRPNVVAPESRSVVDVRVVTQEDGERITKAIYDLKSTVPGTTLKIHGAMGRPALESTPRNEMLWELAQSYAQQIGLELERGLAGGGSDGSFTSQFTATLDGLGAVGDGAHAPHECIDLDKTIERAALLALLLCAPPLQAAT